jgi:hypothetical protein
MGNEKPLTSFRQEVSDMIVFVLKTKITLMTTIGQIWEGLAG